MREKLGDLGQFLWMAVWQLGGRGLFGAEGSSPVPTGKEAGGHLLLLRSLVDENGCRMTKAPGTQQNSRDWEVWGAVEPSSCSTRPRQGEAAQVNWG